MQSTGRGRRPSKPPARRSKTFTPTPPDAAGYCGGDVAGERRACQSPGAGRLRHRPPFRDDDTFAQLREAASQFDTDDFQSVTVWPAVTRTYAGLEGLRKNWLDWLEPWATYRSTFDEIIDLGDRVVILLRDHGRRKDMETEVELFGATVLTFREGKIARWGGLRQPCHSPRSRGDVGARRSRRLLTFCMTSNWSIPESLTRVWQVYPEQRRSGSCYSTPEYRPGTRRTHGTITFSSARRVRLGDFRRRSHVHNRVPRRALGSGRGFSTMRSSSSVAREPSSPTSRPGAGCI